MFNKNDDNKKKLDEEKLVEEEESAEAKNSTGEAEAKECENCAKSKKEAVKTASFFYSKSAGLATSSLWK